MTSITTEQIHAWLQGYLQRQVQTGLRLAERDPEIAAGCLSTLAHQLAECALFAALLDHVGDHMGAMRIEAMVRQASTEMLDLSAACRARLWSPLVQTPAPPAD